MEETIINIMIQYFGSDTKRINHALKVYNIAREISKNESCNYSVVITAAILHDVGIKVSEKKYGSANGKFQELEGPPVIRELLNNFDINQKDLNEVCDIVAKHHTYKGVDTNNFRIIWDADKIVNIEEGEISRNIKPEKLFLTGTAKKNYNNLLLMIKNKKYL